MKKIIKEILKKFEEADQLMAKLTPIDREKILQQFNETATLQHCIRWGMNTCDEILESGL